MALSDYENDESLFELIEEEDDNDVLEEDLTHEGVARRSGRYPWGSGENPHQRGVVEFTAMYDKLKAKGLTDTEIAKAMDMRRNELQAQRAIIKNQMRAEREARALTLKEAGYSNVRIGEEMGINESTVRALLDPSTRANREIVESTANLLRDQVAKKEFIDIGSGVELEIGGLSPEKLRTAVTMLENEGYQVYNVRMDMLTTGKETTLKVLAPPGTEWADVAKNKDKIRTITDYTEDGGRTFLGIEPPVSVNMKRVDVRYGPDGGADKDGVIELRRGVDDISLGESRYAQVRIQVGDGHYLKGMAMYSDNLPDGVDILFNTNKDRTGNKLDAMKPLKELNGEIDADNPFGSIVRQRHYTDASGKKRLSALNIVGTEDPDGIKRAGEEGAWGSWSANLSSQMLSKQPTALAKAQLQETFDIRKSEFDAINKLTNPAVKQRLLESFADDADSAAVHLKAAGLPRTANHVLLPINSLKDTEIYAPNFNNGERVALIRHPHGGRFEIPELTVNNRNREALSVMRNAADAVGINSKVASRLSGADFDGDTVLVIPQGGKRRVSTQAPLSALKDFDPQKRYPGYEGMPVMRNKQRQMGDISNLITDMQIKGATDAEIARAVKHSMVVIDAEKHKLNYKQSAKDNQIAELKTKYQGGPRSGASTLISRAKKEVRIDERKDRTAAKGGPIDPKTGKKMYENTGRTYNKIRIDPKTGAKSVTVEKRISKVHALALTDDARTLMSKGGSEIESIYATHSNRLKALANQARKASYDTNPIPYSPSAKKTYAPEVAALNAKLNLAVRNAPRERQANLVASAVYSQKRRAKPGMEVDEARKIKSQALQAARRRTGAERQQIKITDREWEAIQSGAISHSKLRSILRYADIEQVKELATPRSVPTVSPAKVARARAMIERGHPQSDVAQMLGVSVSTLASAMKGD